MSLERYTHHDVEVTVESSLRGKHRGHCLCEGCQHFAPTADDDEKLDMLEQIVADALATAEAYGFPCPDAAVLYALTRQSTRIMVAPVYECSDRQLED